jgi:hypothetical protein
MRAALVFLLVRWYRGAVLPVTDEDQATGDRSLLLLSKDAPDVHRLAAWTYNPLLAAFWRLSAWVFDSDVCVGPSNKLADQQGVLATRSLPAGAVLSNDLWRPHMNDGRMRGVPGKLEAVLHQVTNPFQVLMRGKVPEETEQQACVARVLRDTTQLEWRVIFERYASLHGFLRDVNVRTVFVPGTGQMYQQIMRDVLQGEELYTYYAASFWINQLVLGVVHLTIPGGAESGPLPLDAAAKFRLPLFEYLREAYPHQDSNESAEAAILKPLQPLWTDEAALEARILQVQAPAGSCPIQ